ncbi:MAG: transglutaminaseTgpA domain-containing protein [Acidimicrobiales bacterium]
MTIVDVDERPDEGELSPPAGVAAEASGTAPPPAGPLARADDVERRPFRLALAATLPTIAAGVMVGGVFQGAGARFYAIVGGLLGALVALAAHRVRNPLVLNVVIAAGLFGVGLLIVLPTGANNLINIQALTRAAADSGRVLRPPVPFTPGWQAIVGWLMAVVGFGAVWLGVSVRRPALGLIVPLPVAAIAGISVPKNQQVGSGLVVLALFAAGLAVLSSAQSVGEDDQRLPIGYELRKAGKALVLLVPVIALLYGAAQSNFLFPKPAIDPTQKPQKPKVTPLANVPDRVLFTVRTKAPQYPFRTGSLDLYDGTDWLLAPFADNRLHNVPRDGIVDHSVTPGTEAEFTVAGLSGAVLPTLPNTVAIVAEGPRLAYDSRSANIRVAQGQVQAGLKYTVTAEALPSADDLRKVTAAYPAALAPFTQIPAPPPAVVDLMAKVSHADLWDEWNQLRLYVLDNVVVAGLGTPVSVPIARVQQVLANPKGGASPYEIVAIQTLLARWVGLPSRIGYGFRIDANAPEVVGGAYQIRPKDGVAFPEVYFPGFEWLPVIGDPHLAKPSIASANQQQTNSNIQPSNDISVQVFLPTIVPPGSTFLRQVRQDILIAVPVAAGVLLLYILYPLLVKARRRSRRHRAALAAGPRARVALAYAELRDLATDFGFRHPTDTPLMFLQRVAPDDEHAELAWLATRALWGDLQDQVDDAMATTAEALSRSLRSRLAAAQPGTLRVVAAVSRLSLRDPYAPELDERVPETVDA